MLREGYAGFEEWKARKGGARMRIFRRGASC
jgi:hypothetical protein